MALTVSSLLTSPAVMLESVNCIAAGTPPGSQRRPSGCFSAMLQCEMTIPKKQPSPPLLLERSFAVGTRLLTSITPMSCTDRQRAVVMGVRAIATTTSPTERGSYVLPTWSQFEMGKFPVFWESGTGTGPASGELLTIFFNPTASFLKLSESFGIGFNGGFNGPIVCGGPARTMTRKDRGPNCTPLYSIRINVPLHARTLEFSFTDGQDWDGPYKIEMQVPGKWQNKPASFFSEGLAKELSADDACEQAIYPDSSYVQDRCIMPGGLYHEAGASCELDIVPGCMDPSSPLYDPLANVDDGTCPIDLEMEGSGI